MSLGFHREGLSEANMLRPYIPNCKSRINRLRSTHDQAKEQPGKTWPKA